MPPRAGTLAEDPGSDGGLIEGRFSEDDGEQLAEGVGFEPTSHESEKRFSRPSP